jgi:hypothetical protein
MALDPLAEVFGSTPDVAPFIPTDYGQEQLNALLQNIGAFPDIEQLGNLYQQYIMGAYKQAGFDLPSLLGKGTGIAGQELDIAKEELTGAIPKDVQSQIAESSAFQSLLSGTSGGGMASANQARNLGLTSLDMQQRGAQMAGQAGNAAQLWASLARGTMMDPSSMLVTPQQRAAFQQEQNALKQATQQFGYNVAAMPNPVAAGISGTIMNLLGAYLGHGMGGGGGSITPSYQSIMGTSGATSPGGGIGGVGVGGVGGFGYGGMNPYTATTGGFNLGGYNYGGQNIPYLGGDAFQPTPVGDLYGTG